MHEILGDYETFVRKLETSLRDFKIDVSEISMMDHLCYRVATQERYQELKAYFSDQEDFVGEALVSGRLISTFEFKQSLEVGTWRIPYLELPAPKESSPYAEGLEHAEFVIIGSLEKFAIRHKELPFNTNGMYKKLNPELGLQGTDVAMKFHEQPLGAVVRIEQRLELSER